MSTRFVVCVAALLAAGPLAAQAKPNPAAAAKSVAVLRDVTNSKVYRVKPGNIIGRLKATTIRPREIVFTVQEFGFERQESLQLAKQEVTP